MKKKKNTGGGLRQPCVRRPKRTRLRRRTREDLENLEKLRTSQSSLDPAHATYQGAAGRQQHSARSARFFKILKRRVVQYLFTSRTETEEKHGSQTVHLARFVKRTPTLKLKPQQCEEVCLQPHRSNRDKHGETHRVKALT